MPISPQLRKELEELQIMLIKWRQLLETDSSQEQIKTTEQFKNYQLLEKLIEPNLEEPISSFQVFVKSLEGKTYTLDISSENSIEEIKEKIEAKIGLPTSLQRLVVEGKQLIDGNKARDYQLEKESVLHLTLRLEGGGVIDTLGIEVTATVIGLIGLIAFNKLLSWCREKKKEPAIVCKQLIKKNINLKKEEAEISLKIAGLKSRIEILEKKASYIKTNQPSIIKYYQEEYISNKKVQLPNLIQLKKSLEAKKPKLIKCERKIECLESAILRVKKTQDNKEKRKDKEQVKKKERRKIQIQNEQNNKDEQEEKKEETARNEQRGINESYDNYLNLYDTEKLKLTNKGLYQGWAADFKTFTFISKDSWIKEGGGDYNERWRTRKGNWVKKAREKMIQVLKDDHNNNKLRNEEWHSLAEIKKDDILEQNQAYLDNLPQLRIEAFSITNAEVYKALKIKDKIIHVVGHDDGNIHITFHENSMKKSVKIEDNMSANMVMKALFDLKNANEIHSSCQVNENNDNDNAAYYFSGKFTPPRDNNIVLSEDLKSTLKSRLRLYMEEIVLPGIKGIMKDRTLGSVD